MKTKLTFFHLMIILILLLSACGDPATQTPPGVADSLFTAERTDLQPGECTILHWQVQQGFGVRLDDQPVEKSGQTEICPDETRTYTLSVDMGTHMERREVKIIVGGKGQNEDPAEVTSTDVLSTGVAATPTLYESSRLRVPAYQSGTWVYTGGPLGGLGYDVRMDPRNPDVMYVTDAYAGVFKSTDRGQNWTLINNGIPPYFGPSNDSIPVFSLTIDPNNPDVLWAGTQYFSGVYRSDDAGQSWQSMNTGNNGIIEEALSIRGFTIEPGNSNVVYFAAEVSSWEWNKASLPGLGLDMTKGAIYKTIDGGQSWKRIWYGDNLARYVWVHPQDTNLLYASTGIFDREAANSDPMALDPGGVGLLRSRDGGATWETLGTANGIDADDLYFGSLFMHPQNPAYLIAAAGNDPYSMPLGRDLGGIYITQDGGDTWTETLDGHNFSSVEICLGDANIAYATSRSGFWRSQDSGQTWQEMVGDRWGPPDVVAGWAIDLQCDPRDTNRVYVNAYGGGVFLSEDGGSSWASYSAGYTGALMFNVSVAANNPAQVFASARSGVFASSDGGDHWLGLNSGPARDLEALALAVDPSNPQHILATFVDRGRDPRVTNDGGVSWQEVQIGSNPEVYDKADPHDIITRIAFAPTNPQLVFASLGDLKCYLDPADSVCSSSPGSGLIVSRDGGQTWSVTSLSSGHVVDIAFSADSQRVYAALYNGVLYRSDDAGQTWQAINTDVLAQVPSSNAESREPSVVALAVDPSNSEKVFLGMNGRVAISQDGGLTWTASSNGMIPESSVRVLVIDPTNPQVVYAGAYNSGVYYSLDGGQTWQVMNNGLLNRAVRDLAISADGSVLYMASMGGGVFRLGTP